MKIFFLTCWHFRAGDCCIKEAMNSLDEQKHETFKYLDIAFKFILILVITVLKYESETKSDARTLIKMVHSKFIFC